MKILNVCRRIAVRRALGFLAAAGLTATPLAYGQYKAP